MDPPQNSSSLFRGCMFVRAISLGTSRSVIVLRDEENEYCSEDHLSIPDQETHLPLASHRKRIDSLTTSNIQVHRKILEQEEECRRSFMLQEGSDGIEALLVPTRMLADITTEVPSEDQGGGIPCKSPLKSLDSISVILGQVHSSRDDDSSTLIVLATENNKNNHSSYCASLAMKEPAIVIGKTVKENLTDDTSATLSVTTGISWTDIDSEGQRPKGSGHRRRRSGFLTRRRKQQQWMASLHNLEPTKNDDSMEMIFFEKLPVCQEEETFFFRALPRLRSSSGEQQIVG